MAALIWIACLIGIAWALAYFNAALGVWAGVAAILLLVANYLEAEPAWLIGGGLIVALFFLFSFAPVRRRIFTGPILTVFKEKLPAVSPTEREALDAGSVSWEGELFKGRPDWDALLALPSPQLNSEELAFLNGPVEELCSMLDDWHITQVLLDLPNPVWRFIKTQGFLGMIIPKKYGGLGFSARAHSEVIAKLSSRSGAAAVSVMVPNSLGPAELLLHYGTEQQKNYFLPRLAQGLEMPCFALTGPEAGSDAASIPDAGVIVRGEYNGEQDVIGILLNWDKRYITLAPIATLLGLAFKLYDPNHLLGDTEDLGITLALIPTQTKGVEVGQRHVPLNAVFQNGPTRGKNVFIPLDWVIGGSAGIGQGWRMLMECLAAGRAISLPANASGTTKLAARTTGAYARVRVQFKMPIGYFEGVEEALARIGAGTYLIDAARLFTAAAIDRGERPSVASAIIKYHLTERCRKVINDAMDVHGGKGIILGPNNYLGHIYQHLPIGITVEGANILTRSLIIFGQGAIRCHPYLLREIGAAQEPDRQKAELDFDAVFSAHLRYLLGNIARCVWMSVAGAPGVKTPHPELRSSYRALSRFSAAFSLLSDVSLLSLGGALKRREKISARLGDILSFLYLSSAVLKRYHDEGRQVADLPFVQWLLEENLYFIQQAFYGVLQNFPRRWLATGLGWVLPVGKRRAPPPDHVGQKIARLLMQPGAVRDRLTSGTFIPSQASEPVRLLELALTQAIACEAIEQKLRRAMKSKQLSENLPDALQQAQNQSIISASEAASLRSAWELRAQVIKVDDFAPRSLERAPVGRSELEHAVKEKSA